MSLMCVMAEKGLLTREPQGRAYVYRTKATRQTTLSRMVADLLGRAFDGSAGAMVAHLLERTESASDELAEIRKTITAYSRKERAK